MCIRCFFLHPIELLFSWLSQITNKAKTVCVVFLKWLAEFVMKLLTICFLYLPVETLCKRMLAATQSKPLLLGQYVPKCDADGHFEKVQCHEGYCFCVDDRGIPDFSTMLRSTPKCAGT